MLSVVLPLTTFVRKIPFLLRNQGIRPLSIPAKAGLQIERIGKETNLHRIVPHSQYSTEELSIEHGIVSNTVDLISHKKYIGVGIGSHGTSSKWGPFIQNKIILPNINNFGDAAQLGEGSTSQLEITRI